MYSNVSVLKMAAQMAPFTVYNVYPIPYTTRAGFLSIQVAQQRHFYHSGTRECLLFVNL